MAIYETCPEPSLSCSLFLISHVISLSLSLTSISGTAIRHCDEHKGWLPPNLFNCTSVTFSKLKSLVCSFSVSFTMNLVILTITSSFGRMITKPRVHNHASGSDNMLKTRSLTRWWWC